MYIRIAERVWELAESIHVLLGWENCASWQQLLSLLHGIDHLAHWVANRWLATQPLQLLLSAKLQQYREAHRCLWLCDSLLKSSLRIHHWLTAVSKSQVDLFVWSRDQEIGNLHSEVGSVYLFSFAAGSVCMNVLNTSDAYKILIVMLTSASSPFARCKNAHLLQHAITKWLSCLFGFNWKKWRYCLEAWKLHLCGR